MQSSRRVLFGPTNLLGSGTRGVYRRHLSGHISTSENEGVIFFDRVFPIRLTWLLRLLWKADLPAGQKLFSYEPAKLFKHAMPLDSSIQVTGVLPRLKDGGAFVKFSHPNNTSAKEVEELVSQYLKKHPVKPWFSPFRGIRTNLVIGKPWLEDLDRFPSRRIKVEFISPDPGLEAPQLSQETLYSFFRKYGRLREISSQPSDSKTLPKFAYLDFVRVRYAIIARNCLHDMIVREEAGGGKLGTVLRLSYEPKTNSFWILNWIVNHPRIAVLAVAAIITTLTVAVFDPIRTFFVKANIEHSFHLNGNRAYKWFKTQATDFLSLRRKSQEASFSAIWDDRKSIIDQIQTWLIETVDSTFIIVQGPRGSGKKELVIDQALAGRPNTLVIDCRPIQEARGDASTIKAAADSVGYYPMFSWMNSVSSLIDQTAQGTIGVKSGFSETLDTQLAKIWQNTSTALKKVALQNRKKEDKDAHLADHDWLEAHPEYRPVVVIDNFLYKNEESSVVYDKIGEWASSLITSNISHVIFLTSDTSYSKSLSKALPYRVFRQIALGDISPQVAKRFVINRMDSDSNPALDKDAKRTSSQRQDVIDELDGCIKTLGGRLTDLEFLAQRLKTGQTPQRAVAEIIDQSASEIFKMYLQAIHRDGLKWSAEQAWFLIRALAEREAVPYAEALLSNTITSPLTPGVLKGEAVLEALSAAELITIKTHQGQPITIRAGKPVYKAAFRQLAANRVLKSRLDLAILGELTKIETEKIRTCLEELNAHATIPNTPWETQRRIRFVLQQLADSQDKVEEWNREMKAAKTLSLT